MSRPSLEPARRWIRPLALVLLFAGAFFGTRTVLAQIEIRPGGGSDAEVFTGKLDHLESSIGEYDTLYIGSSRTLRGFVAGGFDAAMAEQGIVTSTFNLGVPGMNGFEALYVARRVLAMEGQELERLIVAPEWGFRVEIDQRVAHLDRVVVWHDLPGTRTAIQSVLQGSGHPWQKGTWVFNHLDSYLTNVLAIGRISNRLPVHAPDPRDLILGPKGDGHIGLDYELETYSDPDLQERRDAMVDPDRFASILRAVGRRQLEPPPEPKPWQLAYIEDLFDLARIHGIEIIFVKEPAVVTAHRERFMEWVADRDPGFPFFDFSDPAEYPELFLQDLYFDRNHLNDTGAELFTALLAEALFPIYAGNG